MKLVTGGPLFAPLILDPVPMIEPRPNLFVLCMHKAASTFVADVLLPSIAIRTAQYNLFNVGSAVIRQRDQEEAETGQTPEWYSRSTHEQLL